MAGIASVVLSTATREFDKEYHYLIPGRLEGKVEPGVRVIVPFGSANRPKEAYVTGTPADSEFDGLKEIGRVLDDYPVLDTKMINLARWMKQRYICTYGDAIKCMIPAGLGVKSQRIVKLCDEGAGIGEGVQPDAGALPGAKVMRNANASRIIEILRESGNECEYEELKKEADIRSFSRWLKALENSGVIKIYEEYSSRVREKTVRVAYLALPDEEIIEEIESNRIKRIQQIRILEMLMGNEYISVADIARFAGVSPGVLDTLKKHGYIDFKDVEVMRDPLKHMEVERTLPLTPTPEQEKVLEKVKEQLDGGRFGEILIHGVTGSGKTEVYLQLIRYVIDCGKQAIVLVPEISLTPQMVERFMGRFGNDVAVLHSRLSLGERYDQWRLIRDGKVKVVVGARSAVFAPLKDLGIVVIDEEHESSYKSEITPKYLAADVARKRCEEEGAVLLYGSATPAVDTFYRACRGGIGLAKLTERPNNAQMPGVHIADMRNELEAGNRSIFSRMLIEEMGKNIEAKQQTILFLNRRGYASFVLCRDCGHAIKCANCNITMTYHAYDNRLICHYCGYTFLSPKTCPVCKSSRIRHFGAGTQRVEEELGKLFPECSTIRMDMDTTACKNSHEEILRCFREKNIHIMVGTQMIAKGHDFPNVTLVGVLAADSLLNTGDYRAAERTFQLITQVAGRAGRAKLPGRVVIQTYNTEDFSILAACRQDYASFYNQEITIREKLDYPPFTNIATVILSGANDRLTFARSKSVRGAITDKFSTFGDEAVVLGPARSPLSKIRNKYRWRIIIKCKNPDHLVKILTGISDEFYRQRSKDGVELSMDINPFNML